MLPSRQYVASTQYTGASETTLRVVGASAPAAYTANLTTPANVAAIPDGYIHAKIQRPSTGVYDFLILNPSSSDVIDVKAIVSRTASRVFSVSNVTKLGFTVTATNLSGTAADADFYVTFNQFYRRKGQY